MRELILAWLSFNDATVLLVDYDNYTAEVKQLTINNKSLETGDLSGLIASGKLQLARSVSNLDSNNIVWLAHHPDKGCLTYSPKTKRVECMPFTDFQSRANTVYGEKRVEDMYKPKRIGEPVGSFYAYVKAVEKKHGEDLKSEAVRDEIMSRTGVFIGYSGNYRWSNYENYEVILYGQHVDRLDFSSDGGLNINIKSGSVDLVYARSPKELKFGSSYDCTVTALQLSPTIQTVDFSVYGGDYPNLVVASQTSELHTITGYARREVDLTIFKKLRNFFKCWVYSKLDKSLSVNLKLPGLTGTIFDDCFKYVTIDTIYPYKSGDVLDLTGLTTVSNSFHNFNGVGFICGIVEGPVTLSFIGDEASLKFDVTVGYLEASFGYVALTRSGGLGSSEKIPATYNSEGAVSVVYSSNVAPNGKSLSIGYTKTKTTVTPWKQTITVKSNLGQIRDLTLNLEDNVDFIVNTPVRTCNVSAWFSKYNSKSDSLKHPIFNEVVYELARGGYPYKNVRNIGEKCFTNNSFNQHTLVLDEGVESIGTRAFYDSKGLDYLVLPRSCVEIGNAAFSDLVTPTGDLTTICVYRDSEAHKLMKKKNVRLLVIDSLEDIPKPSAIETESDFIAAFVETPVWADVSKPYVARVLTMSHVDLLERVQVVAQLSPELVEFFETAYVLMDKESVTRSDVVTRLDLAAQDTGGSCPDGSLSRYLIQATALNDVYGSSLDLLDVSILSNYKWDVKKAYGVSKWTGTPRFSVHRGGSTYITLYSEGDKVFYVGCADLSYDVVYKQNDDEDWLVPREVLSGESLMGEDVQDRLFVSNRFGNHYSPIKVHGDSFSGEANMNMREFLFKSMVLIGNVGFESAGRTSIKTRHLYDVVNKKMYKFNSNDTKDKGSLGTYRCEVSIPDFKSSASSAFGLEAVDTSYSLSLASAAQPSFELEYCRTHPQFNLLGKSPRVDLFIDLLSKSGFVKRITESVYMNKAATVTNKLLADGNTLSIGKTRSGNAYVMQLKFQGKVYCFEAGFDMFELAEETDKRVVRRAGYPHPENGYLNIVHYGDLFALTPVEKSAEYRKKSLGIYLALDFTSGKLVFAYSDSDFDGIVCSFDTARDARDCWTEFGFNVLGKPDKYGAEGISNALYMHRDYHGGTFDLHPHQGSVRITNSLKVIGGKAFLDMHSKKLDIYNSTILKYGRV